MTTHGGARPGSGRKPAPKPRRVSRATLPADVAAALDRLCQRWGCSEPEAVRRAIVVADGASVPETLDETLARVERETFTHADREWARQDAWERRPENINRPKCDLLREWASVPEGER
jgi:hypothetical protein